MPFTFRKMLFQNSGMSRRVSRLFIGRTPGRKIMSHFHSKVIDYTNFSFSCTHCSQDFFEFKSIQHSALIYRSFWAVCSWPKCNFAIFPANHLLMLWKCSKDSTIDTVKNSQWTLFFEIYHQTWVCAIINHIMANTLRKLASHQTSRKRYIRAFTVRHTHTLLCTAFSFSCLSATLFCDFQEQVARCYWLWTTEIHQCFWRVKQIKYEYYSSSPHNYFYRNKVLSDCIRFYNPSPIQKFSVFSEFVPNKVAHRLCASDQILQNFMQSWRLSRINGQCENHHSTKTATLNWVRRHREAHISRSAPQQKKKSART